VERTTISSTFKVDVADGLADQFMSDPVVRFSVRRMIAEVASVPREWVAATLRRAPDPGPPAVPRSGGRRLRLGVGSVRADYTITLPRATASTEAVVGALVSTAPAALTWRLQRAIEEEVARTQSAGDVGSRTRYVFDVVESTTPKVVALGPEAATTATRVASASGPIDGSRAATTTARAAAGTDAGRASPEAGDAAVRVIAGTLTLAVWNATAFLAGGRGERALTDGVAACLGAPGVEVRIMGIAVHGEGALGAVPNRTVIAAYELVGVHAALTTAEVQRLIQENLDREVNSLPWDSGFRISSVLVRSPVLSYQTRRTTTPAHIEVTLQSAGASLHEEGDFKWWYAAIAVGAAVVLGCCAYLICKRRSSNNNNSESSKTASDMNHAFSLSFDSLTSPEVESDRTASSDLSRAVSDVRTRVPPLRGAGKSVESPMEGSGSPAAAVPPASAVDAQDRGRGGSLALRAAGVGYEPGSLTDSTASPRSPAGPSVGWAPAATPERASPPSAADPRAGSPPRRGPEGAARGAGEAPAWSEEALARWVRGVYARYNPGKLHRVGSLLAEYESREAELVTRIVAKYRLGAAAGDDLCEWLAGAASLHSAKRPVW